MKNFIEKLNPFKDKAEAEVGELNNEEKFRKIEEFVIQKTNEWRGPPFTDNLHLKKPYHEASVNDVQLGEGLRELEIGRPERLNKILDDMIEKCTKIDPSWESEITYLNEIKQFIDEYKSEY